MEFLGTAGNDTLQGTAGNDTLIGLAGDDSLVGGAGDDIFLGNNFDTVTFGRDTLEGGAGNDGYFVSFETGGGTLIRDTEGDANVVLVVAQNSDLAALGNLDPNNLSGGISSLEDPNTWGDSFIQLSRPQAGIVGLERSGNNLIIDINRDGVAEAENDLTIANYFNEQGNLGAGAPVIFNNIINPQSVVNLFSGNTDGGGSGAIPVEESTPIFGTAGNDTLQGTEGGDFLIGLAGDDSLIGGAGEDILLGNDADTVTFGRDTLEGGGGNDAYLVGLEAGGGTLIRDTEGDANVTLIIAEDTNLDAFDGLNADDIGANLAALENPDNWGASFIELSRPQAGIVGLERSGNNLIIDINRDGVAEAENDLTIANYFNEQGNAGAGAPVIVNNLIGSQGVIDFFNSNPGNGGGGGENPNLGTTVYRFFNNDTNVHFYTADENERAAVADFPNFNFEGASYRALDPLTEGGTPVYRFLNRDTGVHLYTVSEVERDATENLTNFTFEGEAFLAYENQVEGSIPIYRFFNDSTGAHFYTPSAVERDNVEENLPDFESEGIAYYALPVGNDGGNSPIF